MGRGLDWEVEAGWVVMAGVTPKVRVAAELVTLAQALVTTQV